jgi:hypothetical protein
VFLRFEHHRRRLRVNLVVNHAIDGKVRQFRIGSLGSLPMPEPFSAADRMKFWAGVGPRYRALAAKRPDVVSLDDEAKFHRAIDRRIPRASTAEERRLQSIAGAQLALIDAIARVDDDGFLDAAMRLLALAQERPAEPKPPSRAKA